ncbi:hypothetical protein CMO93_04600 [Candidatus Woesearchaeota archaeon]|nr:hypothetical protein [Candidatus Woesearchaeota archaeon]|tara:strand:+ start:18403 stop:20691 length:2289 start_codon:yes stop_codon:yes gene_type:complete
MKFNKHVIPILIILIIAIFTFSAWFNLYEMPYRGGQEISSVIEAGDFTAYNAVNAYITRESILNKHDLTPLWNPYILSGTPFFIKPQVAVYHLQTIFLLLSPNSWLGIKLSIIFHFILAGISMYFLIYYLKINNKIALATGIIFMSNPYIINEINRGHTNILYPYSIVPLIILFTLKALDSKNWLKYGALVGVLFALQIHSGGQSIFLFTSVLFGFMLFYNLLGNNIPNRLVKVILIGTITLIILLGLAAVKILPSSDFIEISSRQVAFSFERSSGGGMPFLDIFFKSPIGILPILLAIPSIFYFKKKRYLMFFAILALSILILTASPLYYLLWKYLPFFDRQKGLSKAIFLFITTISILCAYGMSYVYLKVKNHNFLKSKTNYLSYFFVILIIGNFVVLGTHLEPTSDINEQINKNQILQFISKQPDKFRFQNIETMGIDWGIGHVSVPLGLEDVFGYDNIWIPDYLPAYLSVANSLRAKLYGILNMKYLTSTQPINITGFKFIKKFDDCGQDKNNNPLCQPLKSKGPYLYENELYLPRAYVVNHSILIVGNEDQSLQIMYALMLNNKFDPSNTLIIQGQQHINSYSQNFLNNFDAIILAAESIDQNSINLLSQFVSSGGKLYPDITQGQQSFNIQEIETLLNSFGGSYNNIQELDLTQKTYDDIFIDTKNQKGFLVLSEKFSVYPGWTARDNKGNIMAIHRANGIISAINLEGHENQVEFRYSPPKFKIGLIISSITSIILLFYFIYTFKSKIIGDKNKT